MEQCRIDGSNVRSTSEDDDSHCFVHNVYTTETKLSNPAKFLTLETRKLKKIQF